VDATLIAEEEAGLLPSINNSMREFHRKIT